VAIPANYNIVVIGMGFIGGFLLPGYRLLLGDKAETNVFGVKATDRDLEQTRARVPFPISVNNTAELLREKTPDIIIMCPPPKQIPVVMQEVLLPYFNEARAKKIPLPDIYTFGPSPDPQLYYDTLGKDINCVKFLPSMAEPYKGVPLQKCGGSFLSFAEEYPFPEDRKQRAIDFSNMFGRTFVVPHVMSLVGLTGKNTARTCYGICFAVSDVLTELGYNASTANVGSAFRFAFRKYLNLEGEGLYPSSLGEVPEVIRPFIEKLSIAWFEGILRYILSTGCPANLAKEFHAANFELWPLTIQLTTRQELETSTKNHATKGGVNEKAINTFAEYFDAQLRNAVKLFIEGKLPESFFDSAEGIAYTINLTVNRHSHRLAVR